MTTFFAQISGKVWGPYDATTLKWLAATGKILPNDLIAMDGNLRWVVASNVEGLFPEGEPAEPLIETSPVLPWEWRRKEAPSGRR